MNTIQFQPVANLTRAELVRVARDYAAGGVRYTSRSSWISHDIFTHKVIGCVDCVRLLLHIAQDVGLLPRDLDLNAPRPHEPGEKPLARDEFMRQLLEENCDPLWRYSDLATAEEMEIQPGSILLFQWPDMRHHVAIKTDNNPLPYGRMVEARDHDGVVETTIMADDWKQLVSAWSIRGVV